MVNDKAARMKRMMERTDDQVLYLSIQRASRLSNLIELNAPNFIIARELTMVNDAVEALFRKRGYVPGDDPRAELG